MEETSIAPWSYLKGIQPVSMSDWPGRISLVLFLGGCNMRCPTCHNKSIAWTPETLPSIPFVELENRIKLIKQWDNAVTITGGEPTQVTGLREAIACLKQKGLDIKLDTNGLYPEIVIDLIDRGLIDLVAVDIKGPWGKYPELTGWICNSCHARDNIGQLIDRAKIRPELFYFRQTRVPKLTGEDVRITKAYLPKGCKLHEQEYVNPDHNI